MKHTCIPLLLATVIPAQSTLFVGPGGYANITAALAAASPGDILEVAPGTYPLFAVDKGVTIRGLSTGFSVTSLGASALPTWNVPSGQVLHIVRGFFDSTVDIVGGRVTLDDCHVTTFVAAAVRVTNATLHMQDCGVICTNPLFSPPLQVTSGDVTMVSTNLLSNYVGYTYIGLPQPLVRLGAARLQASFCSLTFGGQEPSIQALNGSTAWLSDTHIDRPTYPSTCPFEAVNSAIRTDRVDLVQGLPAGCSAGTPGTLLGSRRLQPLHPGGPFGLEYHSAPNDVVVVFAGPTLSTVDWSPFLEQPSWLDDQSSFALAGLLADSQGVAIGNWSIPANPALLNTTYWFKGVGGFAGWPLQASPVVGGLVR